MVFTEYLNNPWHKVKMKYRSENEYKQKSHKKSNLVSEITFARGASPENLAGILGRL